MKTKKISFVTISKVFIKVILLLFLCNTIYLFINWGYPLLFFWTDVNFFNTDLKDISNFFIRVSIYIGLVSFLIQLNLGIINQNIFDQKKNGYIMVLKKNIRVFIMKFQTIKKR